MILSMKDICKDFPLGKDAVVHILKHINFELKEGDYAAIMGPSGSGKSTLMNLIGFLDTPTSGDYIFDGENMAGKSDNQLAEVRNKDIGFVFQTFNLLPKLSAQENVALPLLYAGVSKKERMQRAEEALVRMGLEERLKYTPDRLSGGQSQRVAMARAIVTKPRLLLADEPTGALDSASGTQIMEIFQQLHDDGATILMITHDAKIAAYAGQQYQILDGELSVREEGENE